MINSWRPIIVGSHFNRDVSQTCRKRDKLGTSAGILPDFWSNKIFKAAVAPPNIALKSSLFPDRDVVGVVAALEPGVGGLRKNPWKITTSGENRSSQVPTMSPFFSNDGKSHGFDSNHFDVRKKTQDVRPSHPSSKSLKAVTHTGRCHLKPPRMSELTARLLRFCCWKTTWMDFF